MQYAIPTVGTVLANLMFSSTITVSEAHRRPRISVTCVGHPTAEPPCLASVDSHTSANHSGKSRSAHKHKPSSED